MSKNINSAVLCLPGKPKPEEKEVGRHPQLRPYIGVFQKGHKVQCVVCGTIFSAPNNDPQLK